MLFPSLCQGPAERATSAKTLNLMGECHLSLGAQEEAVFYFEQTLKLNPKYLRAYHNLADLMQVRGNLAAARGYLEEANKLSPLNSERLYCLGRLCLREGDLEEARQYLEESWRLGHYASADLWPEMAETFLAAGLDYIAADLFLRAIGHTPHEVHLYHRLGLALRRQQKHLQALDCYHQALKLDPKSEKTYFDLGMLYFDLGEKRKALQALRAALKLRPDFTEAQDFLQRHFST